MLRSARFIVVASLGGSALVVGADTFLDGTHRVRQDIEPGVYQAPGGEHCTWAILGEGTLRGTGRNPIVEIKASDLAFHAAGCGIWREATQAELEQARNRMWLDTANMLIAALSVAIRETADSDLAATIYSRTEHHAASLMATPGNPQESQEIMEGYLARLAGADE